MPTSHFLNRKEPEDIEGGNSPNPEDRNKLKVPGKKVNSLDITLQRSIENKENREEQVTFWPDLFD